MRGVVQSHRLTPSVFDGQKVRDWTVEVSDGLKGGGFRDGAGDWVQALVGAGAGRRDRRDGARHGRDAGPDGASARAQETIPREAYLSETLPTRVDAALAEIARAAEAAEGPLDAAHRLSAAVAEAIAYKPGATQAQTTAAEALALGEGVCQDHAHALIAVARRAGPAGALCLGLPSVRR